jgi:hypothetical protein
VNLDLPAPTGTVAVRSPGSPAASGSGGPAGPRWLRVAGGISHLRLDGTKHEQVAGDRRFLSPGYAAAADRFEIEITGGASEIRIAGV